MSSCAEPAERNRVTTRPRKVVYADFFSVVNLVGLLIQLFAVSRIVGWIGVHRAVMVLPLIAMGSYVLMALFPIFSHMRTQSPQRMQSVGSGLRW